MPTLPKLDWKTVDISTMPAPIKRQYDSWKKLTTEAAEARDAMQAAMTAHLQKSKKIPSGQAPAYAFNWGKVAIAFADPEEVGKAKGGSRETFSF